MNISLNKKIKMIFFTAIIFTWNFYTYSVQESAFEEKLIAQSTSSIQLQFPNLVNTRLVGTTTAVSGTVTQASSMAVLTTIATNASNARILSQERLTVQPGQGVSCIFSAIFSTGVANNNQLVGIGNAGNGFFFGFNGVNFGVMFRTNISGSVVDTWIPEVPVAAGISWRNSMMGFNFDPTRGNIYKIQYEAVEFGTVKFFIENQLSGKFELVHQIFLENIRTSPFLGNLTMQLMAESINVGASTGLTLRIGSMAGFVEGKASVAGIHRSINRAFTTAGATTEVPLVSIVNKTVFPDAGPTNQVMIYPDVISLMVANAGAASVRFALYLNITPTGGSLVNVDDLTSVAQKNITPTGITADLTRAVAEFHVVRASSQAFSLKDLNISLAPGDTLVVTVQPVAATATPVGVAIGWTEAF